MKELVPLTGIEVEIVEEYVAVPQGTVPVFVHQLEDRILAYVYVKAGATLRDDLNRFDLYPLGESRGFMLKPENGTAQLWYMGFGKPTGEAMKQNNGTWKTGQWVG